MEKVEKLLQSITAIIQKADEDDDDLAAIPSDLEGRDKIIGWINDYEAKVAKMLRKQKRFFIKGVKGYTDQTVQKDVGDLTLLGLLQYVEQNLFPEDSFEEEMSAETQAFLTTTISELSGMVMEAIDKDVAFEQLSGRTVKWIEEWSSGLAEIMRLGSHEGVRDALTAGLEAGEGIPKIVDRLKDLPQFDRVRARRTAITEILAANSRSQWEAYTQSPAVTGKTWKHSGSKAINPRKAHVQLSGTTIPVDEKFDVNGYPADHPRDKDLPAKERVECHCVMSPAVDRSILGISKEEKEAIRAQVLAELENG